INGPSERTPTLGSPDHGQSARPGGAGQREVVRGEGNRLCLDFLPEERRRKMDGVERPEDCGKRLSRALEDHRHGIDQNEALKQPKDSLPPPRQFVIREVFLEADPVQGPQTLDPCQSARDRMPGLVRSGQGASLTENGPQDDRRIDVSNHRWLWRSSRRISTMSRLVFNGGGSFTFPGGGAPGSGRWITSTSRFSSRGTRRATGMSLFVTVTVRPRRARRT